MRARGFPFGAISLLLLAAAALALLLENLLPAFEPCRVLYRAHQPVQDSTVCQLYSFLALAGLLALLLAFVLGFVAAARRFFNRRPTASP